MFLSVSFLPGLPEKQLGIIVERAVVVEYGKTFDHGFALEVGACRWFSYDLLATRITRNIHESE